MHGRVVFPIHIIEGQLIAYVGRWAEDPVPSGKRKYFLPPGFRRGLELYNLHRAIKEALRRSSSKVTSMCCDSMRQGISVVSIMGASITDEQVDLLKENFDRVLLLMDGDEPGRKSAVSIAEKLVNDLFVRIVTLPEGIDPDHADEGHPRSPLRSITAQVRLLHPGDFCTTPRTGALRREGVLERLGPIGWAEIPIDTRFRG